MTLALNPDPITTVSRIEETALKLDYAYKIATAICGTALAPKDYRNKPEDGAAAILFGDDLGLAPLASLQNIFIVNGMPGMYARTMAAILISQGHDLWTEHEDEGTATVSGRRKGSERVETVTFTIEMARRAGYTSNKKYETDPKSMLYARALAICCRRIAPDALLGMPFVVEELEELADEPGTYVAPERSATARLRSAITETAPVVDAEPPADAQPAIAEPAITAAQLKELAAALELNGITDRHAGLAAMREITGREITKSKDLTEREAASVIAGLTARSSEPAAQEAGEWPPPTPADDDEPPAPVEAPPAQPTEPPITAAQRTAIFAGLNGKGVRGKDDQHRVMSLLVHRPIGSANDLTRDDASQVIDTVDSMTADDLRQLLTDDAAQS